VRLSAHAINAIISAGTCIIIKDKIYIIFPSIYILNAAAKYRQFQCVYTLFMPLVACGLYILIRYLIILYYLLHDNVIWLCVIRSLQHVYNK
jgi:hypothetical protein